MTETTSQQPVAFEAAPAGAEGSVVRDAIKGLACAIVAFFLPAPNPHVDIAKLGFVSILVVGFFLFTSPYYFPGGADQFTDWANALAHGTKLPPQIAQRDIGFPLLILLSGYTVNGSFIGITLIHALFAILMPLLLYLAVYRLSQPVAFLTAACAIISLAPIYFMKWIHHDQSYIFFTILSVALLARYVQGRNYFYLYSFTLAVIAASVSRPAGNVLFPCSSSSPMSSSAENCALRGVRRDVRSRHSRLFLVSLRRVRHGQATVDPELYRTTDFLQRLHERRRI